jgi:hypothetical protein
MRTTSATMSGLVRATGRWFLGAGVLLGDEPVVPPEDCVRGDDARDGPEATPTEGLSLHRQAAASVDT